MPTRVSIKEFGITQKAFAGAAVTFYETDVNGAKTSTKATLYQEASGSDQRSNPQTLDADGKLAATCYVESAVIAEMSNLPQALVRSVQRVTISALNYPLPMTNAALSSNDLAEVNITGGTIDGATIGATTPDTGKFTTLECSSFTETSDERLKTDINALQEAIDIVCSLKPVTFMRKTVSSHVREEIGLIAQEVREVLPSVVIEGSDGYLSIAYIDLIPLLIRAVQQQQDDIVELTKQINEMKGE